MTTYEAMKMRRSIRKFDGARPVPTEVLTKAVDVARLAPCGTNAQTLKFCVVTDPALTAQIFAMSAWGAHLKDGSGRPGPGQEPPVWMLILHDAAVRPQPFALDIGAAIENIIIYCQSEGVASCWLENIRKKEVGELLQLPENLSVVSSVALGYPAMESKEVPVGESGLGYYWGEGGKMNVPKRSLEEVMILK
jgi:nitroreductase